MEIIHSIFDAFEKSNNFDCKFEWNKLPLDYKIDKSKFVWTGMLQEFEVLSPTIRSTRTYAATRTMLFRFQTKDLKNPEAALHLNFTRIEKFKDVAHWKYGFCLTSQQTTYKFAAYTEEEALTVFQTLLRRSSVVGVHFSKYYTIGELIGQGNYTRYHSLVQHESGKKFCAKSIYKRPLLENPALLERVKNEINILQSLNHPNISSVHQIFEAEKYVHLIIDYQSNKDMLSLLLNDKAYSEMDIAKLMRCILNAVI